jgi:hypothetical protein
MRIKSIFLGVVAFTITGVLLSAQDRGGGGGGKIPNPLFHPNRSKRKQRRGC